VKNFNRNIKANSVPAYKNNRNNPMDENVFMHFQDESQYNIF